MDLIVAIDGSEPSDRAIDHAVELAAATGGAVTLVHAVDPQVYEERAEQPVTDRAAIDQQFVMEAIDDAEERGERLLDDAATGVGMEVSLSTELLYGDPVEAISEYADNHEAIDGIVVGHRQLADQYERVLGSVAKGLVERAPVPVTVVR